MAAGDYASLSDYLAQNQGLGSLGALLSDVPGLSSLTNLLPALSSIAPFLGIAGGIGSLVPLLGDLFGGGRSSTGPGSATSDIASAASSTDPVLALLGEGAGALSGDTPVSSPSASSTFGPYFGAALGLENLLRWGPGGINNPNANKLDSETLKNLLHEQGNPGTTNDPTTKGVLQAFQTGQQYLTPQNINLLLSQESPQEQQITRNILNQTGNGNTQTAVNNPQQGPFNLGNQTNNILGLAQLAPLMALMQQKSGPRFSYGWTVA